MEVLVLKISFLNVKYEEEESETLNLFLISCEFHLATKVTFLKGTGGVLEHIG